MGFKSLSLCCKFPPVKDSSFEPELNQRPKDINICNLQSSALPTELSKGPMIFNSVEFFWKMSISCSENVKLSSKCLCQTFRTLTAPPTFLLLRSLDKRFDLLMIRFQSLSLCCKFPPVKDSSFEPELNQRPKDINICNLQSSALPTELSKGPIMFNSEEIFWKMSISCSENFKPSSKSLWQTFRMLTAPPTFLLLRSPDKRCELLMIGCRFPAVKDYSFNLELNQRNRISTYVIYSNLHV